MGDRLGFGCHYYLILSKVSEWANDREPPGKWSILDSPPRPLPSNPCLVLVHKDFIEQKHEERFWEESTRALLPAHVCVLCFQMFPDDLGSIWGRKFWTGILMAAVVLMNMTSCERWQNKSLSVRIRGSQSHIERLRYATLALQERRKEHGLCPQEIYHLNYTYRCVGVCVSVCICIQKYLYPLFIACFPCDKNLRDVILVFTWALRD